MRTALNARFLWLPTALLLGFPAAARAQNASPAPTMRTAPMTLSLDAKNDSRIQGTVTLTPRGDSTVVELSLSGAKTGETVQSHIHFGTCDTPGGVVAPLESVTVGSDGSGSSRTTVARSRLDDARKAHGSLLVQAHMADGKPAACADVPAR